MAIDVNSRNELKYEWLAEYDDRTTLAQFDNEKDQEFSFKDIRLDKLISLSLIGKGDLATFKVSFKTGNFWLKKVLIRKMNGEKLGVSLDKLENVKITPILFRRVKRYFQPGQNSWTKITYFLGYEGKGPENSYVKEGIQVFEDGSFALPPKDSFHAL